MSSTKLSGADYFFLVIAHHLKTQGIAGLDCRYIMRLDSLLPKEKLETAISASPYFQLLERTRIQFRKTGIPKWILETEKEPSRLIEHHSNSDKIPEKAFEQFIPLTEGNLYRIDLVQHPTYSTVVFSWHHLILDAFGASHVLASVNNPKIANVSTFFGDEIKESKRKQWSDLMIAKNFLKDTTKDPLLSIKPRYKQSSVTHLEKRFSVDETAEIRKQIHQYSRGGIETPYLLGNIAIAYQQVLQQRGEKRKDIWVPIPMEQRKAGVSGPIVGNWHSLIFFRIKAALIDDKKAMVKDLNNQLFEQVKLGIPQKYAGMLRLLRHLPIPFYYKLIKRPNGNSLSGMLYSQSPSHQSLSSFLGCRVTDTTPLPPNTSPPGISFQITTFDNRLKVIVQYSESYFSETEIRNLLSAVENELIGENA